MATAAPVLDLERRKQVRLRLRADLVIGPQKYEGRTYYVVKDPVNLRYYRLDDKHYFLVQLLDGTHTLDEVQKEFENCYRPDRLTLEQLEAFAQQLLTAGLAHNDSPQAGKQLFEHRRKRLRSEWMQTLTNVLYIKIPLYDPDKLLARMLTYLRWIFTTWFTLLSAGVVLAAVLLVATHFGTFLSKLPTYREFFSVKTFFNLGIALMFVKVIHEFGHGLSCKAFGGECHEMGALFLCFTPCLYCNVSDAWTLPNKWKRIIISFAGIYVELMIAALATFVWWNSPGHPFVNNLSLALIVVCSISTVVFNGNPLMRYDGYYVLFDWLEIPNLRDRSNRYLKNLFLEHCLGVETPYEPYMALSRRVLFVIYAVASWLYRWVVTFSILWFFYMLLKPKKLGALAGILAIVSLASMLGWPLFRMSKNFNKRGRLPDMKPRRVSVTAAVLGAVVVGAALVPLPLSRVRDLALVELQPEAVEKVFVPEEALLEKLYIKDGQEVQENDLLAEFRSLKLENELGEARSEYDIRVVQIKTLQEQMAATTDPQARIKAEQALVTAIGEREKYAVRVPVLERRIQLLQVRAPRKGIILSPPHLDQVGKVWDKDQSAPFCSIGDPTRLRALMPVSAASYHLLKEDLDRDPNLAVTIRVEGLANQTWRGVVGTLPESEAKEVPLALTSKAGGPLAVRPSQQPNHYVPQNQQYLVPVNFKEVDGAICPGAMAQVKVHCRWRTTAWWLWRTISSAFDLGLV